MTVSVSVCRYVFVCSHVCLSVCIGRSGFCDGNYRFFDLIENFGPDNQGVGDIYTGITVSNKTYAGS